jgi:hypothetical protein
MSKKTPAEITRYSQRQTKTVLGNAEGDNNLPVEERRRLREQENARRAAEIRDGLSRVNTERLARRKALLEALGDGSAGDKLKATLKKLAAERRPTARRYIPISDRARAWSA